MSKHFRIPLPNGNTLLLLIGLTAALAVTGCTKGGTEACQKTEGTARVTCAGSCPSSSSPSCYVKYREAGSSDEWNKTGQPGMNRPGGQEYACYCDT